jgi:hypothetical protein
LTTYALWRRRPALRKASNASCAVKPGVYRAGAPPARRLNRVRSTGALVYSDAGRFPESLDSVDRQISMPRCGRSPLPATEPYWIPQLPCGSLPERLGAAAATLDDPPWSFPSEEQPRPAILERGQRARMEIESKAGGRRFGGPVCGPARGCRGPVVSGKCQRVLVSGEYERGDLQSADDGARRRQCRRGVLRSRHGLLRHHHR